LPDKGPIVTPKGGPIATPIAVFTEVIDLIGIPMGRSIGGGSTGGSGSMFTEIGGGISGVRGLQRDDIPDGEGSVFKELAGVWIGNALILWEVASRRGGSVEIKSEK